MPVKKSIEQYIEECQPIAAAKGIEIIGIVEPFTGQHTKMINRCQYAHEWNTTTFKNFKTGRAGCPVCAIGKGVGKGGKTDDQHIKDFINTGKFKPGTIFTNTGKRKGSHILWMVECPVCSHDEYVQAGVCDGKFYIAGNDLKKGIIPCRCTRVYRYTKDQITYKVRKGLESKGYIWMEWISKPSSTGEFKYGCKDHGEQIGNADHLLHKGRGCPQCKGHTQQQAYINYIYDEQNLLCALKFGIANSSDRRIKEQNSHNVFTMKQSQVWHFPTVKQCKDAEKRCKRVLHTEAVSKYSMPDGYTETVELSCMASIQNIYKLYGGILQEETC